MGIPIGIVIPRTRRGLKILMIILAVVCAGLSVFGFISYAFEKKSLAENGQLDFNTLEQGELADGMNVKGVINLAVDWYAEEYEADSQGNRTSDKSEALYYLVPVYDSNADGTVTIRYFVTYKAEPKDFDTMDAIVNQTWSDDPMSAMLTLEYAQAGPLSDEFQQYLTDWTSDKSFYENGSFIDWCVEYNILGTTNRNEIASKLTPYVISKTDGPGSMLALGITCIILAGLSICMFCFLKFAKYPIQGVIDPPTPVDFSKLREMEMPSAERNERDGLDT